MEKFGNLLQLGGLAILGGGFFLNTFFYTVDAGHRAIIFDKAFGGVKEKIVGEGMHFYIPFIQVSFFYPPSALHLYHKKLTLSLFM